MPKDGTSTKERILTESRKLLLDKGYAGMSIDQILEKTNITKGAFFYHYKSKADLGLALIERFAEEDMKQMELALMSVEEYKGDSKEKLLMFVQYFIDLFSQYDTQHPGCLYISYIYEPDSFDNNTKAIVKDTIIKWRETLSKLIDAVKAEYDLAIPVEKDTLADYFNVVFEGAFVLDKAMHEKGFMAQQLNQIKNYYDLLFSEKK